MSALILHRSAAQHAVNVNKTLGVIYAQEPAGSQSRSY